MVKTRHGGGKEEEDDNFVTLRAINSKRNSISDCEDIISTVRDHNYYTPGRKRQRTYNVESSSGTSKDSPVFSSSGSRRRGRGRGRGGYGRASADATPVTRERRFDRRMTTSTERMSDSLRRSSRERPSRYSTMDQNLLAEFQLQGAGSLLSGQMTTRRSAKLSDLKQEEDGKLRDNGVEDDDDDSEDDRDYRASDKDQDEDMIHEDMNMYSRLKKRRVERQELEERRRQEAEEERKKLESDKEKEEAEDNEESDEDSDDETSDDDDDTDEEEDETRRGRSYHLREHREQPKRFEVPVDVGKRRRRKDAILEQFGITASPARRHYSHRRMYFTPVKSPRFKRHKHHATHNSSSTSSDESDDERKFERRKSKSMAKARRRCLPMNFASEDAGSYVIKDRQRIGTSLADVDPMNIDTSVTFESVGGLGKHLQALKEMVVFPLLYPEVFERFKITPPRGVLFHGPPGTGKTLVARALANECRNGDKRVAFFMRKGADCLSKWVGESERQLRLLFDQAYTMRPSIIFFDEIDGLAPVRSSRQDQIHSSIVSTLLALMDGLDSRGEIVVIGATNRIDSIDPALRRPGRFDREFLFSLPSQEARHSILSIHTKEWNPKLSDAFLSELAEKCVGYCGADVKALCTEAALFALRHQFPQIYSSKEKLQLDPSQIQVTARDFHMAMQRIVPAAQRAVVSPGRGLNRVVKPLLQRQMTFILEGLKRMFPAAMRCEPGARSNDHSTSDSTDVLGELLNGDDFLDETGPCIYEKLTARRRKSESTDHVRFLDFESSSFSGPSTFRPRLLIMGHSEQGHSSHLAPAILHQFESLPVHCLDLPTLYAVSAKTPEESCAQVFREARRTAPSIIYMPHISQWWQACSYTLQATFLTLLQDLPPTTPILIVATADCLMADIPEEVKALFPGQREVYTMRNPTSDERREFFSELILVTAAKAPPTKKKKVPTATLR